VFGYEGSNRQTTFSRKITPEQYRTFHSLLSKAAPAARAALDADTNLESVGNFAHSIY
jgi:hypothetical protein